MTEKKMDAVVPDPTPEATAAERVPVPAWVPPIVYALATLIVFREFVVSNDMLFGGDTLSLGYMARAFFADALKSGVFPLWNPIILGGTPFLDSLAGGDSLYPPSVALLMVMDAHRALGWKLVLHVFLAGWLMYGWTRTLGISRAASLLAGLAYLMAPFLVTLVYPGHDGKMFVTALAPLGFLATERVLTYGALKDFALLALTVGAVILTTHFQMAYFLFGGMGAYGMFRLVQQVRGGQGGAGSRRFALFLAGALLGAGIAAVQLLPAIDYIRDFSRRAATTTAADPAVAVEYSSSYSLHPEEAMSLVVGEFVGHGLHDGPEWTVGTYWGRNALKLNHEYLGWAAMLVGLVGLFGGRGKGVRWFLFGMGAVALLFALGRTTPVWRLFYEVLPGISLFRAPSQAIFLVGLGWLTLTGFGIDRGFELFLPSETKKRKKDLVLAESSQGTRALRTLWGVAAVLGLAMGLWATGALPALWTSLVYSDIAPVRADALVRATPFITRGFMVATVLAIIVAGVWTAARRGMLSPVVVIAVLGLTFFGDAARIDDPFVQTFDFGRWSAQDENTRFLMAQLDDPEPWRALSMVQGGQDVMPGLFGIELAGGHHPNDLGRYRELIGMEGSGGPNNLLRNPELMRLLNVRYLQWPVAQMGDPLPGVQPVSQVTLADGRPYTAVYELPTLPRARLVGRARAVPDEQAVATMMAPGFDPTVEVILPQEPPIALSADSINGTVRWLERGINQSQLQVESDAPALLVISDNWYPEWSAVVNGEDAPVLRAYHALRAIPVPAGRSTVDMVYRADNVSHALKISLGSLLLVLVVGGLGLFLRGRAA